MKTREYISDTCEVICEDNGRKIVAEVLSFQKKKTLIVSLDRSVKLELHWTGRAYTGGMGNLTFISNGPDIQIVKISR